MGHMHDTVIS